MNRHVIYIPGLGDRWDPLRRFGLWFWKRKGIDVTLVPMRWSNPTETYEAKTVRIKRAIDMYPDSSVTLVGESAGGAVAIALFKRYRQEVDSLFTICGMNQGEANVHAIHYRKNPAFRAAMQATDRTVPILTDTDKKDMFAIYSSLDETVGPKHTLIRGVRSHDIKVPGHLTAIAATLLFYKRLILK